MDVVEAVLAVVRSIPEGKVTTYGAISDHLGLGSPRLVGEIMAEHGDPVPWHRVVSATGRLVPGRQEEVKALLLAEGVPFRGPYVHMLRAVWDLPSAAGPAEGQLF